MRVLFIVLMIMVACGVLANSPPFAVTVPQVAADQKTQDRAAAVSVQKEPQTSKPNAPDQVVTPNTAKEPIAETPPRVKEEGTEYWSFNGLRLKITDSLLALFTFLLFLATLGLWISTRKLWLAGERQAKFTEIQIKLARDEYNYINRPRLTLRREKVRFDPKDSGINLVLTNVGNLPATNIVGNFNVQIVDWVKREEFQKESLPPYGNQLTDVGAMIDIPPRNSRSLEAGQQAYIFLVSDLINEQWNDWHKVKHGRSLLHFFGYLTFVGPDGVSRQSAFFRTYRPNDNEFSQSEDPDYEHS